jgi:Protein of unknown function (DUF3443)
MLLIFLIVSPPTTLGFAGGKAGNSIPITVNGRRSLANGEPNQPFVSVTICNPISSSKKDCQTINNILLDTGSEGLRIFSQVVSPNVLIGSDAIGECISFEDGTSLWGTTTPVDVILGSEKAANIRMQLITNSYPGGGTPSSPNPIQVADCPNAVGDPATAGFNGILGVSVLIQDSGAYFDNTPTCCPGNPPFLNNPINPPPNFVSNPVAFFSTDNNGIIVELPAIPQGGASSATGSLLFGIGTQTNNTPAASVVVFPADANGDILTGVNGPVVPGSLDTGSNGLFLPDLLSVLPVCNSDPTWFCPASFETLSATNIGAGGAPSGTVTFQIGDHDTLISSGSLVFNDIGGPMDGEALWGLPFFFGRHVFFGIDGRISSLGTGPYCAY